MECNSALAIECLQDMFIPFGVYQNFKKKKKKPRTLKKKKKPMYVDK